VEITIGTPELDSKGTERERLFRVESSVVQAIRKNLCSQAFEDAVLIVGRRRQVVMVSVLLSSKREALRLCRLPWSPSGALSALRRAKFLRVRGLVRGVSVRGVAGDLRARP